MSEKDRNEQDRTTEERRPTTSPPDPDRHHPPGGGDLDEEALEKGKERLDQAAGSD